jgi:hypothetical protein
LPMPKLLPLPKPSEARPTPFPAPTVLGTVVTAKPKLVDITGPQTQPPAPGVKPTADYSGPQTQPPNPRLVPQVLPMPVAVMPVLVKPVVAPPVRGMPTRAATELYDKTGQLCLDVQCIATVSATVK